MIELESMAVEMPEVEGHPNRAPFRGVLTVVDIASQRAPLGSKGRRVVLTKSAAEAALPSLLGMALDYAPSFDRHDQRRKVGVITSAEIVERNLEVGGYLYAKDFPDVVEEVGKWGGQKADLRARTKSIMLQTSDVGRQTAKARLRSGLMAAVEGTRQISTSSTPPRLAAGLRSGQALAAQSAARMGHPLGMSFEVANVTVMDLRAPVWVLTKVTFTGAAILRRGKAAYEGTWIELA
jgi:hypothetical protein